MSNIDYEKLDEWEMSLVDSLLEEGLDHPEIADPLRWLADGYMEYATEVITDRAVIGIDGLKPSQRRSLYALKYKSKASYPNLAKSLKAVGDATSLHPHGDASLYQTMVRMCEETEYLNVPLTAGGGNFGKVWTTAGAAAARYTRLGLSRYAEELFRGMKGVDYKKLEEGEGVEPVLLPVSFPLGVCNPSSGIAVGVASDVLPYNFNEILEATIELIETGSVSKVLVPDFTTAGECVYDESELRKIMYTGRGKVTVRGKWTVDGNKIIITEFPYNVTIESLQQQIDDAQIQGAYKAQDGTDYIEGKSVIVECASKRAVEKVLSEILRVTDLQKTMHANMMIVTNNEPKLLGVVPYIREWVEFRKGVILRQSKRDREVAITERKKYVESLPFLRDFDAVSKVIEFIRYGRVAEATKYMMDTFDGMSEDTCEWLLGLQVRSFSDIATKEKDLKKLDDKIEELDWVIANPEKEIVRQLQELNKKYVFPRMTDITDEVYTFEKPEPVVVKARQTEVALTIDGKFIKRTTVGRADDDAIRCMSDDIVTYIDNYGRIFRVMVEHLPVSQPQEKGTYLPLYLEINDDFEIVYWDILRDKKVGFVYTDGYVSVVDFGEWARNDRLVRITSRGISPKAGDIMFEFDPVDSRDSILMCVTEQGRVGFTKLRFKEKHRTARTKLMPVPAGDSIVSCVVLAEIEYMTAVANPQKYWNKMRKLEPGDVLNPAISERLFK